jgi:hypothetical protein
MGRPTYKPEFEKQATGSALQWSNCAAASGAMLADAQTIGLEDPTPDQVRAKTGDFIGGLYMGTLGAALEKLGIEVTTFDSDDHLSWDRLRIMARRQMRPMVLAGDYDRVPYELRGDKDYGDGHSVLLYRMFQSDSVIGDPLNDGRHPGIPKGYVRWPNEVVRRFVGKFDRQTTGGIHACVARIENVTPRSQIARAEVRATPEKDGRLIGTLTRGHRLRTGGKLDGDTIRGSDRWFRVWYPALAKVGYMHDSVVVRV